MKRPSAVRINGHPRKLACSIPAAALMLGVSHAATIGFNFQCNYCNAHSYSGAVVTAPAFGVETNAWESLPQMDTGYGCAPGYYTLDQVIDRATLTGSGLNPLPHGSIHATWSAYTANVSGFGGYTRSGPHYTFGGNGYNPGNEQVYWGFLRDGVNFGPGSSGGDNNQPGYNIELTGLKSFFTNSPFAVQLIASADSMQFLTNAFIIDMTGNMTTQSVFYPSTPPVADVGDTAWIRGIGGGLSTASGAFNTDHLMIVGNRAAHGGNKVTGANFASTIAGFILTDKPVLSMTPYPAVVSAGDTIVWSAYAVGVPPLSYQWRRDGQAIPGATLTSFGLTNVSPAMIAQYDVLVTNLYGAVTSGPVTIDRIVAVPGNNLVVDSNPSGPEHDGLNNGASWLASSTDGGGVTRTGLMKFTAASTGQIVVPGETNFNTDAGAITFWVRTTGPTNTTADKGSILFDRHTSDGMLIALNGDGTLTIQAGSGANSGSLKSAAAVADNKWHQVAVTFDNGVINLYVDGASDSFTGSLFVWPQGQELEFGLSHDASWQPYDGLMSDVRVYNRSLTDQEISAIQNTGGLVDANALIMRLEFAAPPMAGAVLRWATPDVVLQSADTLDGNYTDVPGGASPYPVAARKTRKFYRYRGHTPATLIANPYLM